MQSWITICCEQPLVPYSASLHSLESKTTCYNSRCRYVLAKHFSPIWCFRKKRSVAAAAPPERPPLNTVTMSSFKRNLIALTRTQDTTPQRKRARVPTPSPPSQQQSENSELPAGPAIEDDAAGMEMGSQEMLTPSCRTLPSAPHSTPVTKHRLGSSSKEAIPSGTADALLSASCQLLGPGESAQQDNSPPLSPPLELPSPSAAALLCTASPAKAAEADPAPSAKVEATNLPKFHHRSWEDCNHQRNCLRCVLCCGKFEALAQ